MRVLLLLLGITVGVTAALIWHRRRSRAVVEGCFITIRHDTHCTAIVQYREREQTIRFGAEVGAGGYLWVDAPESMYTDDGDVVSSNEYQLVKQRLTVGLSQLGIAHELVAPEPQNR